MKFRLEADPAELPGKVGPLLDNLAHRLWAFPDTADVLHKAANELSSQEQLRYPVALEIARRWHDGYARHIVLMQQAIGKVLDAAADSTVLGKSLEMLCDGDMPEPGGDWVELPEDVAAIFLVELEKSRGVPKYIRRIFNPTPPPKYRYFYNVTGGSGLGHASEVVEGSAFAFEHEGQAGHYHVKKVENEQVSVEHSVSGHQSTMHRNDFTKMLRDHHVEKIRDAIGKVAERRQKMTDASTKREQRLREMFPEHHAAPAKPAEPAAPSATEIFQKLKRQAPGQGKEVQLSPAELSTVLASGKFALVSAGRNPNNPQDVALTDDQIQKRYSDLKNDLVGGGYAYSGVAGKYEGSTEDSFLVMVHDADRDELVKIGAKYNQDSIIYADSGKYHAIYTTGANQGKEATGAAWHTLPDSAPDNYTAYHHPDGSVTKFSLDINWGKLQPVAPLQLAEANPAAPAPAPEPAKPAAKLPRAGMHELGGGGYDAIEAVGLTAEDLEQQAAAMPADREYAVIPQAKGFALVSRSKTPAGKEAKGAKTTVLLKNETGSGLQELPAEWVVMEADDIVASHNPMTFDKRQDYPEGVQERRYHEVKDEQLKIDRIARNKATPTLVANTNPDSINGAPVVTEDGVVLGGNGRTMGMQRAYQMYPENAQHLKEYLANQASQFGLRGSQIMGMQKPILVRRVQAGKDTEKLTRLGRRMNESLTQGLDPRAEEVAVSKFVTKDVVQSLSAHMEADQTLADFLQKGQSLPFIKDLEHAGIIDATNRAQYVNQDTGLLNEQGRLRVSRVLAARMIPDPAMLDRMDQSLRNNLALAVPFMLAAEEKGWDLREPLLLAVKADHEMSTKNYPRDAHGRDSYIRQPSLFGDKDSVRKKVQEGAARALLEIIQDHNGPKKLQSGFKSFAIEADAQAHDYGSQGSMFARPKVSQDQALLQAFKLKSGPAPETKLAASWRQVADLVKAQTTPEQTRQRALHGLNWEADRLVAAAHLGAGRHEHEIDWQQLADRLEAFVDDQKRREPELRETLREFDRGHLVELLQAHGQVRGYKAPESLRKADAGPYIGPRGGKWADPQHTIPWQEPGVGGNWLPSSAATPPAEKPSPQPATPQPVGRVVSEYPTPEWAQKQGFTEPWRSTWYSFGEQAPEHSAKHSIDLSPEFNWKVNEVGAYKAREMLREQFKDAKPEPGHQLVYRIGTSEGALHNRNAGSLEGVLDHLMSGEESPGGKKLTAYSVKLPEQFGEYEAKRGAYIQKAKQLYIGPKGGKWADAKHTQHWEPDQPGSGGPKPPVPETFAKFLGSGGKVRKHETEPGKAVLKIPMEKKHRLEALQKEAGLSGTIEHGPNKARLVISSADAQKILDLAKQAPIAEVAKVAAQEMAAPAPEKATLTPAPEPSIDHKAKVSGFKVTAAAEWTHDKALDAVTADTGLTREQVREALQGPVPPGKGAQMKRRVAIESALLKTGLAHENALGKLLAEQHDKAAVAKHVQEIVKASEKGMAAALDQYKQVPLYDLQVLSEVKVSDKSIQGYAVCYMNTRSLAIGIRPDTGTWATGDFRHELGHAIHAGCMGSAIDEVIRQHYKSVKAAVEEHGKAPMKGPQSSDWYEEKIGVTGKRGLDNAHEDWAEHYRCYHRAWYQENVLHAKKKGSASLAEYRNRHPEMAAVMDARYTAALLGQLAAKGAW